MPDDSTTAGQPVSPSELGRLYNILDNQRELIGILENRLMPVSHGLKSSEAKQAEPPKGTHISGAADETLANNKRLSSLIDNLAV